MPGMTLEADVAYLHKCILIGAGNKQHAALAMQGSCFCAKGIVYLIGSDRQTLVALDKLAINIHQHLHNPVCFRALLGKCFIGQVCSPR